MQMLAGLGSPDFKNSNERANFGAVNVSKETFGILVPHKQKRTRVTSNKESVRGRMFIDSMVQELKHKVTYEPKYRYKLESGGTFERKFTRHNH